MKRICFCVTVLLISTQVQAQDAESLFQEGMKLVDSGKVSEGCDRLQASYKLEPGFGVLFNLADCHERIGKTSSAWTEFKQASELAKKAGQADRETKASRRAEALEPKLVRILVIKLQSPNGLKILLDGAEIAPGAALLVDPGQHLVTASAPGYQAWSSSVEARAGLVTVNIPELVKVLSSSSEVTGIRTRTQKSPLSHPPSALHAQRIAALGLGGLTLVGLGVGTVTSFSAKSTYDDSGSYCDGNSCSQDGLDLRSSAFGQATISTVAFSVAGVALATGIILWITTPTRTKNIQTTGIQF